MRNLLALTICLLSGALFAQEKEIKLSSTISEVTVFQQGAQISRAARANIPVGTHQLIFEDLHPTIDPNQVKVSGTGDFTILSISHDYKTDTIAGWDIAKKQTQLTAQRNALQEEINRENGWLDIYNKEEQLLLQNQIFGTKEEGTNLDILKQAADFTRERYMDIRARRLEINDKVANFNKQIQEINTEMNSLGYVQTDQQLRMVVRVQAKKAEVATFKLNYQVASAGWYAAYDARVESIAEPMQLDYNAFVYQTTGEDWDDISLTISTGTPRQNKTKPNLNTWNLFAQAPAPVYKQPRNKSYNAASANQYLQSQAWNPNVREVRGRVTDEYGQSLPFVNITLAGSNQGCTTDVNGNYYIAIPQGYGILNYSFVGYNNVQLNASSNTMNVVMGNNSISLDEVQVLSAPSTAIYDLDSRMNEDVSSGGALFGNREKKQKDVAAIDYAAVKVAYSPTQTQFKVDANYNIPANGSHYAVRVSTHEVEADYLYQCAPKLDPLAYLTARVTDWEDLNLLAGNMNIYFEDTYIGQSKLDLSFVEDTLAISLGPDRNIQVKRNRIKADSKKEFISGKKNIEREWEITVLNNKRVDINIRIEDQIPVSSNEEVEIDSHVDGGKLNKDTGIITWDFDIKAGKKKEIKFDYEVRFPKNLMVKLD